jgi:alkanesulfonate monooxygenase SsuD/methylene tetrahydromethanopterin reductase-like flavin-dependent oxidoreductase (luciferase family)
MGFPTPDDPSQREADRPQRAHGPDPSPCTFHVCEMASDVGWQPRDRRHRMSRIGIAISGGPNPAEIVDLVVLAERLGYESAWVAEGHGGDQFAIPSACAMRTSRILLGTSISSVFVRTAPTIAMAASSIADLSGGRSILGLGSSHKAQVGPEHGVGYGKPLTRTRETVAIVRALIGEGRVRFDGETLRIESFDLWYAPRTGMYPCIYRPCSRKGSRSAARSPTASS